MIVVRLRQTAWISHQAPSLCDVTMAVETHTRPAT